MGDLGKISNGENSGSADRENDNLVLPKSENLDDELSPEGLSSIPVESNVASSSGSDVRSLFIEMGFLPSVFEKVIEEKGEDNVDVLLETLFALNETQKGNSESSDSLSGMFNDLDDNDTNRPSEIPTYVEPKEEPYFTNEDVPDEFINDKRKTLLAMNFPQSLVELAMVKLGEGAQVSELVDYIFAAQIAENIEKESTASSNSVEMKPEVNHETLYGTMDKTLRLLEMGSSEVQVSLAFERLGSEAPLEELANAIFGGESAGVYIKREECSKTENGISSSNPINIKTEDSSPSTEKSWKGKRPKEEYYYDGPGSASQARDREPVENYTGKKQKQKQPREYIDNSGSSFEPSFTEEKPEPDADDLVFNPKFCRSLVPAAAKPPYFFYGNVTELPPNCWAKISKFLFTVEPEFARTQFFSAINRKEGYVHNLPTENRFHIIPKPPMTIQEVLPRTKKYWPPWDTRKHLSHVTSDTNGIPTLCDRLRNILVDSGGVCRPEQEQYIFQQCRLYNLVWVGHNNLEPIEPEIFEQILGYPLEHTQVKESRIDRLKMLEHCFQTDTLGYHLSVLKSLFPRGLTVLSIFSGIGGAEITLARLGIPLKAVVSIETCEVKRRILKGWWRSSGQTGELVQIESVQSLTTKKLASLFEMFGSFDLLICQNPCSNVVNKNAQGGFDFSLFYEFVRVLQRTRDSYERR